MAWLTQMMLNYLGQLTVNWLTQLARAWLVEHWDQLSELSLGKTTCHSLISSLRRLVQH